MTEIQSPCFTSGVAFRLFISTKIGLPKDPFLRKHISILYPEAIFIWVNYKEDIATLKEHIAGAVKDFEKEKQQKTKKMART